MVYDSTPIPRRKSCEACKKAKRRCDLSLPACSRCIHRSVPCIYPWQQPLAHDNPTPEIPPVDLPVDPQWDFNDMFEPQPSIGSSCQQSCPSVVPELVNSLLRPENEWIRSLHLLPGREVNIGPSFALVIPRARQPKPLPEIIASHLQFAIDILKDTPRKMVFENQTSWCHPNLYKNHMPRAMQGPYMLSFSSFKPF